MVKTNEERFQEHVDELLLMEKRIERKTQQLTEYNDNLQKRVNYATEQLDKSAKHFDTRTSDKLDRLLKLQELAHAGTKELAGYNKKIAATLKTLVMIALVAIGGATWRLQYLCGKIDKAKLELGHLEAKLKFKPIIATYAGKYYIKIVKFSDLEFNERTKKFEKQKFGTYAEIWHKEK